MNHDHPTFAAMLWAEKLKAAGWRVVWEEWEPKKSVAGEARAKGVTR